jgi:hypothetical protein
MREQRKCRQDAMAKTGQELGQRVQSRDDIGIGCRDIGAEVVPQHRELYECVDSLSIEYAMRANAPPDEAKKNEFYKRLSFNL